MSVRRYVAGAALAGALGVGAVGMAGTASAERPKHDEGGTTVSCNVVSCNSVKKVDKSTTTVTKTATPTVNSIGQFGNGNVNQTGVANGIINNPQVNAGNNATSGSVNNTSTSTQKKQLIILGIPVQKTEQSGLTGPASNDNYSNNSSSVNNAQGNGKNSSVNVGNN